MIFVLGKNEAAKNGRITTYSRKKSINFAAKTKRGHKNITLIVLKKMRK